MCDFETYHFGTFFRGRGLIENEVSAFIILANTFPNISAFSVINMKTKKYSQTSLWISTVFFLAPLWMPHLCMYFDHKKISDLFLHGPFTYLYLYFMKLLSSLLWYITVLHLSEDSSSLAATAVASTGKDMASGERW